jgi:type I restriction enzyme S subunit
MSDVELPNGWVAVKLGEISEIKYGKGLPTKQFKESGYPVFGANGVIGFHDEYSYEDEQLLISCRGANSGTINFSPKKCFITNNSLILDFHVEPVQLRKTLFYFLQSANKSGLVTGTAQPQVTINNAVELDLALPPLNEQYRIVAKIEELFSELDKGIENLKAAREQLKVYRQALLKHAFEGKLTAQWREQNRDKLETATTLLARIQTEREQRYQQQLQQWQTTDGSKPKAPKTLPPLTAEELAELPELPKEWLGAKLGLMTCGVEYGTAAKSVESGACPVLRMGNIQNGQFDWSDLVYTDDEAEIEKYLLCEGDVLFNRTNSPELVGKSAIFKSKQSALFAGYLIRVNQIPTIVEAAYLNYFLNSHIAKQHGNTVKTDGVNQSNINGGKLINYPFPFCTIEEQKEIVAILDAKLSEADQLELTLNTSLQQAEALRQSILKQAFTGQLVAQDANDEPASELLERIKAEKAAQAAAEKTSKLKKTITEAPPAKSNVIPFPSRIANIPVPELHAGIMALAYQMHEQKKRSWYFGHVKAEKISHMVEAHLGIELERQPIKDAAGPNDFKRLLFVEAMARKAKWFDVRKLDSGRHMLYKDEGFDALVNRTKTALSGRLADVEALIAIFVPFNRTHSEIVATLYAAWNNLLLLGQSPTDKEIVSDAYEDWHPDKTKIRRERFFRCLDWMRKNGLAPAGRGKFVNAKSIRTKA